MFNPSFIRLHRFVATNVHNPMRRAERQDSMGITNAERFEDRRRTEKNTKNGDETGGKY